MKVRSVSWVLAAVLFCVASRHGVLSAPAEVEADKTADVKEDATEDPESTVIPPVMLSAAHHPEAFQSDLVSAMLGRKRRSPTYKKYGGGGGGYYPQQGGYYPQQGCSVCQQGYPQQGHYPQQGGGGAFSSSSSQSQSSSSSWGGAGGKK